MRRKLEGGGKKIRVRRGVAHDEAITCRVFLAEHGPCEASEYLAEGRRGVIADNGSECFA